MNSILRFAQSEFIDMVTLVPTPPPDQLPVDEQGLAVVRHLDERQGDLAPARVYRVPLYHHGERLDVVDPADDPWSKRQPLQYRTEVNSGTVTIRDFAWRVPNIPDLWGVAVNVSRRFGDDMRSIVAFDSGIFSNLTVIDEMQFPTLGVDNSTQVAAVVWSARTGIVDQIYVGKDYRRTGIGKRVALLAGAYHYSRGWPGIIRGDGRRTALGQSFVQSVRRPHLIPEHTELNPPMDPD
jgi:hypothetical protein